MARRPEGCSQAVSSLFRRSLQPIYSQTALNFCQAPGSRQECPLVSLPPSLTGAVPSMQRGWTGLAALLLAVALQGAACQSTSQAQVGLGSCKWERGALAASADALRRFHQLALGKPICTHSIPPCLRPFRASFVCRMGALWTTPARSISLRGKGVPQGLPQHTAVALLSPATLLAEPGLGAPWSDQSGKRCKLAG